MLCQARGASNLIILLFYHHSVIMSHLKQFLLYRGRRNIYSTHIRHMGGLEGSILGHKARSDLSLGMMEHGLVDISSCLILSESCQYCSVFSHILEEVS